MERVSSSEPRPPMRAVFLGYALQNAEAGLLRWPIDPLRRDYSGLEAKLHFAQRVLVLLFCLQHLAANFVFRKVRLLPPIEFSYRMINRSECFFVLYSGYPFLDCRFVRALQMIEVRISHGRLRNLNYRRLGRERACISMRVRHASTMNSPAGQFTKS